MTTESTLYEAQKKKLQGLCDEHELTFRFVKDKYPITLTIRPVQGMDAQMSMLETAEDEGYISQDAYMTWSFKDGALSTTTNGGIFTISKTLRQKIESVLMKMIIYWQQYFFRDIITHELIKASSMPEITEEPGKLPDAEPIETYDDIDTPEIDDEEVPDDE